MSKRKKTNIQAVDHEFAKEFVFGPNVECVIDPNSQSRYINLPFTFSDKSPGILVVLRAKDESWIVADFIKSIIINYNEDKTD